MRNQVTVIFLLSTLLFSCWDGERSTGELTRNELAAIRHLGILDSGEVIIQLHCNVPGSEGVLQAGNFFTSRRVGRYWIDDKDTLKNKIMSAWLVQVDTLIPYFNNHWPSSSYIEIRTGPHTWFNLYVNGEGDDAITTAFYQGLLEQWNRARQRARKRRPRYEEALH